MPSPLLDSKAVALPLAPPVGPMVLLDLSGSILLNLFFKEGLPDFYLLNLLHLSLVKQMYSQPIHITHDLILCLQITRGMVDFNRDSSIKFLAGTEF